MSDALLAVMILLPAVLTFLLKSNAAIGFLALCGGFAAITLSGSDIDHLVGQTKITSLTSNNIDLALLLLPLLITLLLTFRSTTSKKSRYFSSVPAFCAGGLLAAVAGPMFNDALQTNVTDSDFWKQLKDAQSYIVGVGLLASLLLIWTGGLSHGRTHKKDKKHK
jgi:hypothetical protein